jgi:antitoxin HicB
MKTVKQYLEMPYHVAVARGDDGRDGPWAASVEELPECTASGTTPEEAVERVRRLMASWIAEALEADREIPEPRQERAASGRLLVRMPQTLHADLARTAETEGISLNQFITGALAAAVAWRRSVPGSPAADAASDGVVEPGRRRPSVLTLVLAANLVVLGVAAVVAVAALLSAWS